MGSALALSPADWVFPSFREMGVHLTLGYPAAQLLQYWTGDERGQKAPEGLNIFPFCVAVASQIPHAVGAAPTLIECLTYRMADHTTADDAGRYRSAEEVALWRSRDPILRLERFMDQRGLWSEQSGLEVKARVTGIIDAAVREMEAMPAPAAAELFETAVAKLSPRQAAQMKGGLTWPS